MNYNCTSKEEIISPKLFIEASAGTGKTFVIEQYVVRAVLDAALHKKDIDPESFAIITFTKAVARELRKRVQKALSQALAYFQGDESEKEVPDYFSLYPHKKEAARALSLFLERLGTASITTIHGFCERLLTIWAEEAGECEGTWEQNQKAWLEQFLQEACFISVHEWNILARQDLFDHDYFLERVLALMDDPAISQTVSKEDCLKQLKQIVESTKVKFPAFFSATSQILKTYATQFKGNCTKEGALHREKNAFFDALQALLEDASEQTLVPLLKLRINLSCLFQAPLRGHTPLPEDQYSYFLALLTEVWPRIETLIDPESTRKRIAAQAAKAFFSYTTASHKKTFETLLRSVLSLIKNEKFCKKISSSFSWVIVDEFQDTDTTQLAIFKKLFLQDGWNGNILFVGDPKQAIYAFRKADVYSYMQARDLLQDCVRTLSVNHRASSQMVEALNILFAESHHPFIFYLPKQARSIFVPKSISAGHISNLLDAKASALHFVIAKGGMGRKRNWPHEDIEIKFLLWMHDELIAQDENGVPFKQQAILVKDRYQARRVHEFLSSKGVPTCSWRLDLITESPSMAWLKKVFLLLVQPKDKKRLLSLLFSMTGQEDVCRQMASENNLTLYALAVVAWGKVRQAFFEGGIGGLKRELYACLYNGQEPLHAYLSRQPNEASQDLEQILEALSMLEDRVPQDIGALYHALGHLEEFFADDRDMLLRRVDPDDEGVPILTMHRSKGLEFDVVYALGVSSRTHDQEGDLEEIDAEKLRQVYVALTRAKKRVYAPLFLEQDGKKVQRGQASPMELLLSCLDAGKKGSLDIWSDSLYQCITPTAQENIVKGLVGANPSVITLSDVESALEKNYVKKEKTFLKENSSGNLFGFWRKTSSFSRQKEKSFLSSHSSKSTCGGALLGLQFHEEIASRIVQNGETISSNKELSEMLHQALNVQLPCGVCLSAIPTENIRSEVPFVFQEENELVSGTIDLVFMIDSKMYVIDWKTQEVDKPLREYILEEQYDLQCAIYKKAVLKAFPHFSWGGFFFIFVRNLLLGKESIVEGDQICR